MKILKCFFFIYYENKFNQKILSIKKKFDKHEQFLHYCLLDFRINDLRFATWKSLHDFFFNIFEGLSSQFNV